MEKVKSIMTFINNSFSERICEITLSGQMPTDFKLGGCSTSGESYSNKHTVKAWAYVGKELVYIEPQVLEYESECNANGSWSDTLGYTAEYLIKQHPNALFFVIRQFDQYEDCNRTESPDESIYVYKASDFRKIWADIEAADLERWNKFFNPLN